MGLNYQVTLEGLNNKVVMKYLGVLVISIVFFACNNSSSHKVNSKLTEDKTQAVVKAAAPPVQRIDKSNVSLEEKYGELKTEKPAIQPKTPAPAKTVQEVKKNSVSNSSEQNKSTSSVAKPKETKAKEILKQQTTNTESNTTPSSSSSPITNATPSPTPSTKPAVIPRTIPESKVQNVPVGEPKKKVEAIAPIALSHSALDQLLASNVSASGKVNYKGLQAKISELDAYLATLESASISKLSRNEKLAFWINAYNAYTIKKILNNYPVSSITDLDGGKPWDVKWIKLDGKTLSLNNIENDIIRPQFKEPRIHFAVNCAAKSCPPLLNKAWTADNLEANFSKQSKAFINNALHNELSPSNCQISKIFEWYAVDFGDLVSFLNKYSSTVIDSGAKIGYKEYDWSLNE